MVCLLIGLYVVAMFGATAHILRRHRRENATATRLAAFLAR